MYSNIQKLSLNQCKVLQKQLGITYNVLSQSKGPYPYFNTWNSSSNYNSEDPKFAREQSILLESKLPVEHNVLRIIRKNSNELNMLIRKNSFILNKEQLCALNGRVMKTPFRTNNQIRNYQGFFKRLCDLFRSKQPHKPKNAASLDKVKSACVYKLEDVCKMPPTPKINFEELNKCKPEPAKHGKPQIVEIICPEKVEVGRKERPPFESEDGLFSEDRLCKEMPEKRCDRMVENYDMQQDDICESKLMKVIEIEKLATQNIKTCVRNKRKPKPCEDIKLDHCIDEEPSDNCRNVKPCKSKKKLEPCVIPKIEKSSTKVEICPLPVVEDDCPEEGAKEPRRNVKPCGSLKKQACCAQPKVKDDCKINYCHKEKPKEPCKSVRLCRSLKKQTPCTQPRVKSDCKIDDCLEEKPKDPCGNVKSWCSLQKQASCTQPKVKDVCKIDDCLEEKPKDPCRNVKPCGSLKKQASCTQPKVKDVCKIDDCLEEKPKDPCRNVKPCGSLKKQASCTQPKVKDVCKIDDYLEEKPKDPCRNVKPCGSLKKQASCTPPKVKDVCKIDDCLEEKPKDPCRNVKPCGSLKKQASCTQPKVKDVCKIDDCLEEKPKDPCRNVKPCGSLKKQASCTQPKVKDVCKIDDCLEEKPKDPCRNVKPCGSLKKQTCCTPPKVIDVPKIDDCFEEKPKDPCRNVKPCVSLKNQTTCAQPKVQVDFKIDDCIKDEPKDDCQNEKPWKKVKTVCSQPKIKDVCQNEKPWKKVKTVCSQPKIKDVCHEERDTRRTLKEESNCTESRTADKCRNVKPCKTEKKKDNECQNVNPCKTESAGSDKCRNVKACKKLDLKDDKSDKCRNCKPCKTKKTESKTKAHCKNTICCKSVTKKKEDCKKKPPKDGDGCGTDGPPKTCDGGGAPKACEGGGAPKACEGGDTCGGSAKFSDLAEDQKNKLNLDLSFINADFEGTKESPIKKFRQKFNDFNAYSNLKIKVENSTVLSRNLDDVQKTNYYNDSYQEAYTYLKSINTQINDFSTYCDYEKNSTSQPLKKYFQFFNTSAYLLANTQIQSQLLRHFCQLPIPPPAQRDPRQVFAQRDPGKVTELKEPTRSVAVEENTPGCRIEEPTKGPSMLLKDDNKSSGVSNCEDKKKLCPVPGSCCKKDKSKCCVPAEELIKIKTQEIKKPECSKPPCRTDGPKIIEVCKRKPRNNEDKCWGRTPCNYDKAVQKELKLRKEACKYVSKDNIPCPKKKQLCCYRKKSVPPAIPDPCCTKFTKNEKKPPVANCPLCKKFDLLDLPYRPKPKPPKCTMKKCSKPKRVCPPTAPPINTCKKWDRKSVFCGKCRKPTFPDDPPKPKKKPTGYSICGKKPCYQGKCGKKKPKKAPCPTPVTSVAEVKEDCPKSKVSVAKRKLSESEQRERDRKCKQKPKQCRKRHASCLQKRTACEKKKDPKTLQKEEMARKEKKEQEKAYAALKHTEWKAVPLKGSQKWCDKKHVEKNTKCKEELSKTVLPNKTDERCVSPRFENKEKPPCCSKSPRPKDDKNVRKFSSYPNFKTFTELYEKKYNSLGDITDTDYISNIPKDEESNFQEKETIQEVESLL